MTVDISELELLALKKIALLLREVEAVAPAAAAGTRALNMVLVALIDRVAQSRALSQLETDNG